MIRTLPLSTVNVGVRHRKDILDDASVVISISLQHGISAAALAKSVSRAPAMPADLAPPAVPGHRLDRGPAPASVIGAALDLLKGFEADG